MQNISESDINFCFKSYFNLSREELLHPITEELPCGEYLKYDDVYQTIKDSRRADDPTLPQGIWSYELKRADWQMVSDVALRTLCNKSKDLQLGIWLLEANIHLRGFYGIAPCVLLLAEMCKQYWSTVHPEAIDSDIEFRVNPFIWANEKLVPVLRLVPITKDENNQAFYSWSDWLSANDSPNKNVVSKKEPVRVSVDDFNQAVSATSTQHFLSIQKTLCASLNSIDYLSCQLDRECGDDAPGFSGLTSLLKHIKSFVETELNNRGATVITPVSTEFESHSAPGEDQSPGITNSNKEVLSNGLSSMQDNNKGGRYETYIQLEQAAHYLMQIDPHSPAPYLILQACRWGNMDTRELYRELFIECKGQLNIFELLGVDEDLAENTTNHAA